MKGQIDMFADVQPTDEQPVANVQPVKPAPAAIKAATDFIRSLKRGERLVYHTGHLAHDRLGNGILGGKATAYMEAADNGQVVLSQRRVAPNRFEYIAIRT